MEEKSLIDAGKLARSSDSSTAQSDTDIPVKKPRINTSNVDESIVGVTKTQADAHVQAFLKAVLDHANTSSLSKKKPKKDASTQTEEVSTEEFGEHSVDGYATCHDVSDPINSVPNQQMYSKETLQLIHTQHKKFVDAQRLIRQSGYVVESESYNSNLDAIHQVTNSANTSISEWALKYEQWFLQNFGFNVDQTLPGLKPKDNHIETIKTIHEPTKPEQSNVSANSNPTTNSYQEPPCVTSVSGAPVNYIIPEGSLCAASGQFPAYFSLIPSFYTPQAFPKLTNLVAPSLHTPTPIGIPSSFPPNILTPFSLQQNLMPLLPSTTNYGQFPDNKTTDNNTSSNTLTPSETKPIKGSGTPPKIFSDLPEDLQTSAVFAAFNLPYSTTDSKDSPVNISQWGPLLRYGTYGRLPSNHELENLGTSFDQNDNTSMPPPPPTFILLRRQAMICALQLFCRDRGRELSARELDSSIIKSTKIPVDYATEFDNLVEKSISLQPLYLFNRISQLSPTERIHYVGNTNLDQVPPNSDRRFFHPNDLFVCDLMVGDVLIAQSCATDKLQARICSARQAFRLLIDTCFVVGSSRLWENVKYLVLCLSSKPDQVPLLPPFCSDPFESLDTKDVFSAKSNDAVKNSSCGRIDALTVNAKPVDDLWLYLASLNASCLQNEFYTGRILAQSALFSQMSIGFEVEVNLATGLFHCNALLDGNRLLLVDDAESKTPTSDEDQNSVGTSLLTETFTSTKTSLIRHLSRTRPIVGLKKETTSYTARPESFEPRHPLWGVDEALLADSLMWARDELDTAIRIEQLEAHCEVTPPQALEDGDADSANETQADFKQLLISSNGLDHLLQCYAASPLVTPLLIQPTTVPTSLWSVVQQSAIAWGLLCRPATTADASMTDQLFVCKRLPLPRIKAELLDEGEHGCFTLINSNGHLSSSDRQQRKPDHNSDGGQDKLSPYNPRSLPDDDDDNSRLDLLEHDPVARLARRLHSSSSAIVKQEPTDDSSSNKTEDVLMIGVDLNQPSNAIEILDDLPKTLIPGIDF